MYLARASMFYWSYYGKIDNLTITTPPDIPLRYPSEKTSLSKADTVYCLKNLIHNSGVRLAEQFPNDFASSTAYYRCTYGIRATAGDLDNLIGPTDPGCGCYSIDGHVFTVNYGCETLSEDNN